MIIQVFRTSHRSRCPGFSPSFSLQSLRQGSLLLPQPQVTLRRAPARLIRRQGRARFPTCRRAPPIRRLRQRCIRALRPVLQVRSPIPRPSRALRRLRQLARQFRLLRRILMVFCGIPRRIPTLNRSEASLGGRYWLSRISLCRNRILTFSRPLLRIMV